MNSGALICTIDKKGDLKDRLSRAESSITLSKESREQIRMAVKDAIAQFDPEHFKTSSDGATMVRSALFTSYVNDGKELVTEMISDADATALYAAESGFLLFYEDGYESKTPESLTLSDFDPALSSRVERKSAETVEEGTFLYKIIPDNRFRLCILLGEEAADRFSKRKELSVRIGKDTVLRAPFSLVTGVDGSAIGVLDFAKYGGNFLKDRFLELFIPFLKDEQKRKGVGKWNKPTDELLAGAGIDANFWKENSLCPANKILVKLSKRVRDYVRTGIVVQKRRAIEGLYTCYGMGNIIQFAVGKAERKTLWDSVEKLIKRRHQVAHGADYLYAGKLDGVDKKEIVRRLGHIGKLVNSIDEVLQLRFKKSKGNRKANKKGHGK